MFNNPDSEWSQAKRTSTAATPLVGSSANEEAETINCGSIISKPAPKSWRRLELLHHAILILGSVAIFAIFAFLAVLWEQSLAAVRGSGGSSSLFLQRILASGWAPRVVTISTAILRAVIAAQAGIFTSMAAALVIERVGVAVPDAPFYSVVRALQSPPHSLLSYMVGGSKGAWRKSRPAFQVVTYALIMIEIAATIASQFLSTIMISDFAEATAVFQGLADPSTAVGSPYGGSIVMSDNYWTIPAAANWRFAEADSEGEEDAPFVDDEKRVDDTGRTLRAFLPFEDERQRDSLRDYEGPTDVFDFRVVCVRPALSELVYLTKFEQEVLVGKVSVDAPYPMLENTPSDNNHFACPLPSTFYGISSNASGLTSICYTPGPFIKLDALPIFPGGVFSEQYMLLDATYNNDKYRTRNRTTGQVARTEGPWAFIADSEGAEMMRVTSCFVNQDFKTASVKMSSVQDGPEPRTSWNREQKTYDTTGSRRQLGVIDPNAASSPPQDRGLLVLNNPSDWGRIDVKQLSDPDYDLVNSPTYYSNMMLKSMHWQISSPEQEQLFNTTDNCVFLSNTTANRDNVIAHGAHFALFQETLRETSSPARAMQALFTRVTQMVFYDSLQRSAPRGRASAVFSTPALLPIRRLGLFGSAAIVGAHLCALLAVATLFLLCTDKSDLGQLWQALAHVVTDETLPVLRRAAADGGLRDRDVRELVRSEHPNLVAGSGSGNDAKLARDEDGTVTLRVGYGDKT